jgi:4-aminobutyrate aminotransferase/(S)-3-amino-2-methylpropionate transaminase
VDTREKYEKYVNTAFLPAVDPLVIDRADGATYFGSDGSSFIDCFAGISVVNTGHANEAVLTAARRQMERLVHCSSYLYHVEVVADLAEKLAQITPGDLEKTFFSNSGAEAVEGSARLAKRYSEKNEAIALTHSFHGRTYGTLSLTGNATRKRGGGPYMPGVAFAPAPYCYRCPLGLELESCGMACAKAIDDVIKFHTADNVAFFVAEPLLGEGGLIVPPDDYFRVAKEVLDEHDVLLIADEVQSGFCRTGKMFAIEHYGVEPDIMAMAKGIANGFPLGAFIARAEIADAFQPGDHLTTFGGNPVACAASLANIRFMEETHLAGQAAEKGRRVMQALCEIKPKRVTIGEIRGRGLMIGIEMVEDARSKAPAVEDAKRIKAAVRDRGVLIGIGGVYGNVLRIQPPLTISDQELDSVLAAMTEVLEA